MAIDQYTLALNNAKNQQNSSMRNIANQQAGVNNTYQDLMNTLAKRRSDATLLKSTQNVAGENNFNNQRDQAVTNANSAMSNDRAWLANHGISNSNENADQMGRLQTKLHNSLSGVNADKNTYNNANLASYNSSLGDIGIANDAGLRARNTSNQGIQNNIADTNQTYNTASQGIYAQIAARAAAIAAQKAQAAAVQRAASQRAASAKKAKAVKAQAVAQAAVQQQSDYRAAIADAQNAAANGNLGYWAQHAAGVTNGLTQQQAASLRQGGATYHHLLTGV